ncbi:MAG TPA: peroxidase [Bradyrhizobium sp.]
MSRAPKLSDELRDLQGMINSGFGWLRTSRFWLLTIADGHEDEARAWLADLVESRFMVTAGDVLAKKKPDEAVAVAFSYAGLARLGLKETGRHPFPTTFRSGMGSKLREKLLRDRPRDHWRWSDVEGVESRQTVHVLVAQWYLEGAKSKMPAPDPVAFSLITRIEDRPNSFCKKDGNLYEPFGFRDGLSQPVIRGLRDPESDKRARQEAGSFYEDRLIAPGEFIVGYPNEYDELTYCPDVQHWTDARGRFTLNGSYLAVRQIQQNVERFKAFATANPGVAEKLMGRQKNGLPLSRKAVPGKPILASEANAFRYRVDDANGFTCPLGSHIRRVNPRDGLGVDVASGIKSSKLHRLLRRGRPYLEAGEPERVGLFFIACNTDLERQFEFIHQRWLRNPHFQNLFDEDDPIVGSPDKTNFTIPGVPSGDQVSLAAFTEAQGGGYFFLPGIRALKFLVRAQAHAAPSGRAQAAGAAI